MTDSVEYYGTIQTAEGRSPVIVRANSSVDRDRVQRETSGGVIFTDAEDMPSLESLLQGHGVLYAVLEAPTSAADAAPVAVEPVTWQNEARDRLAYNRDIVLRDEVFDEDFVFLASLPQDRIDTVLKRAEELLDLPETSEAEWTRFLETEARFADDLLRHEPLPFAEEAEDEEAESSTPPLLTLDDLAVTFTRGAFGGPRALASSAE